MMARVLLLGTVAAAATFSPAGPRFSWSTVPVFYHSCNFTGPFLPSALDVMAKFPLVTVEKGQGVDDPNDGRYAEDKIIEALRGVKQRDPNVSTIIYFNNVLDWPFYKLHEELLRQPKLWVRDSTGTPCRSSGDPSFPNHTAMLSFDFAQAGGRSLWASACLNATSSGVVDGCFSDRANGRPSCYKGLPTKAAAYKDGQLKVHQDLQASLENGLLIANNAVLPGVRATMIEGFKADEASILKLQAAAAAGKLVQAHAGYGEDGSADDHCSKGVTNSLSAFLIGAGEHSYYGCSRGWKVQADPVEAAWRPEYERPLGTPTGPGRKDPRSGVYRRTFRSERGTSTVVTFDTATNQGSIAWGSEVA
jgi:hypothetical protein